MSLRNALDPVSPLSPARHTPHATAAGPQPDGNGKNTIIPEDITGVVPAKFLDPFTTADGQTRAAVKLGTLRTLWINTGTLCNITCENCYIESSPRNDRLAYIRTAEVRKYLDEIEQDGLGTEQIGLTGGEPFMNPDIIEMLGLCLARGFEVLVLTNAMRPMRHHAAALVKLRGLHGKRLAIRVSLDHYTAELHEQKRGLRSWQPAIDGLRWLAEQRVEVSVAGRSCWRESREQARRGYANLFASLRLSLDAHDSNQLILFPEMDARTDAPEITVRCWDILGVSSSDMMCASSRMIVKRKGATHPVVVACTLIPYDPRFELGATLAAARGPVQLNHPHCAQFCVLGGGSCTAARRAVGSAPGLRASSKEGDLTERPPDDTAAPPAPCPTEARTGSGQNTVGDR